MKMKIMSKLDVIARRVPQHGHGAVRCGDRAVDVRGSSMPTHHGDKPVLRLLDPSRRLRRLTETGLVERDPGTLRRLIERPEGLILVTGPPPDGKARIGCAIIQEIVSAEIDIMTIEGLLQPRHGWSAARARPNAAPQPAAGGSP